ncbi:MAG: hypothetical protein KAQ94_06600 [Arcobacteraceae bacterium]|nr:hypothetical protein [Arcobacteraceae bacterium]
MKLDIDSIINDTEENKRLEKGGVDFSTLSKSNKNDDDTVKEEKIPIKFSRFELPDGTTYFIVNNWMENPHPTLLLLDKKGAAVWMYEDGEFAFRRTPNSKVRFKMTKTKLIMVLSKLLNKVVVFDDNDMKKDVIKSFDLLLVSEDVFNPFIKKEFFEKDDLIFRNTFRQTSFMELDKNQKYNQPVIINKLINHLVRNDQERYDWLINWLAYFFQELRKSPVALFLKGCQRSR